MADVIDDGQGDGSAAPDTQVENTQQDRGVNLHAEMTRKLERQNEVIESTQRKLDELMSQMKPAAPAAPKPNYKDMMFDDPDGFVETITREAISKATETANRAVDQRVQLSTSTQNVIGEVQAKYPEFAQPNSAAAQLALSKANSQEVGLRGTPTGIRLAMLEAAADLGLVPATRRQATQQDDSFALGSSTTASRQTARGQKDLTKDIDPMTLAFAQEMGVDLTDPKRVAGLVKAAQRKNYTRYS